MKEPTRDEFIEAVNRGDHSLCEDSHDLLGTCPIELGLEVLAIQKQRKAWWRRLLRFAGFIR